MSSGGSDGENHSGKGMPRDHRRQNEQTRRAAKRYHLTEEQQEALHDEVHGKGYGFKGVMDAAREIAEEGNGKPSWRRNRRRRSRSD